MTPEERELACREYARSMPGAVEVVLGAGDVAFYRAGGWHLGNYVPYARRATLHDGRDKLHMFGRRAELHVFAGTNWYRGSLDDLV
jgi:hypothetical protein